MAKYNFTAIMSLQLVAIVATLIACAPAMEGSSSKFDIWAEQNKMTEKLSTSTEQIKLPPLSTSSKFEMWAKQNKMAAENNVKLSTSTEQIKSPSSTTTEEIKSPSSTTTEEIKSPPPMSAEEEKHMMESCPAQSSLSCPAPSSLSCPAPSPEQDKAEKTKSFRPKWAAEEMENMSDNQLKQVAASLMVDKEIPAISFHSHPKNKCWQKCAFEKMMPLCENLSTQSSCLLTGGKACALQCTAQTPK